MDTLLARLADPQALLLPVLLAAAALVVLAIIFRALRHIPRVRNLALPYLLGSLLLTIAVLLDGEGLLPAGWPRNLLLAATIVCWSYVLIDLGEAFLFQRYMAGQGILVPRLARDIVRTLILLGVILLVLNTLFGIQLTSLVVSSTVLSAVLGLALQDLLKNVIAGVALQAERPFQPGDWVQLDQQIACVDEMSWRATRLITVDQTHITIPNANLAQARIDNFTHVDPRQALHVQVAVAYQHPPNDVKRVLAEAALAAAGVLPDPAPAVRLIQYGDYSITYDIKFWMHGFDRYIEIRDAVMTSVWYHLKRAGIKLPFPIRDVYMHQVDPLQIADEHHHLVTSMVQTLRGIDLFATTLNEEELALLAEQVTVRIYGRGELLATQGETGDVLFVIRRGCVRVDLQDADGRILTVGRLQAGDFFGELALLTGEPRAATVIAEQDTETIEISRAAIAPLLARNPGLPERLGAVLADRVATNQATLAAQRRESPDVPATSVQRGLVSRIIGIFNLNGRER